MVSIHVSLVLLQNRNSVQLRLFDSGLQVLQARLGGVCTGRGLSCGAFWVITAEVELIRFCRGLNGQNDGSATDQGFKHCSLWIGLKASINSLFC